MRSRDPFGVALASLRQVLAAGLPPGQHLPVSDLAAGLKLSTSPVREALSRLCGEGLVEDRRGLGYFTRGAAVEDIVGLLDLEAVHVALARRGVEAGLPSEGSDAGVEAWIVGVMERCESQSLVESVERVHRRLEPLRRLHGPVDPATPLAADPVDAYYDRWRNVAGSVSARARRRETAASESIRNTV